MNNDQNQPNQMPNTAQAITPPPAPAPAPSFASPAPQPPVPRKKKGLIIGIIAGVVGLLLIVGIGLFILLVFPSLQRASTADSFLKAVTTGDIDKAVSYTDSESNRDFVTHSADKLKNAAFKLKDSEFHSEGDSYYLFALTNSEQKSARVTVEFKNGRNIVTGLVYSPSQLKLVPGKVEDTADVPSKTPTANTEKCFAASDYSHALGFSNTTTYSEELPLTSTTYFLADSVEYDDGYAGDFIRSFPLVVQDNPGKDYTIHLQGFVATSKAADRDFANRRAQKVKNDLVAKGIPASKIIFDEPQDASYIGGANTEDAKRSMRSVAIKFFPGCATQASTSNGR